MIFDLPQLQNTIQTVAIAKSVRNNNLTGQIPYENKEELLLSSLNKLSSFGSAMVNKHGSLYHYLKKDLHLATDIREFVSKLPEDEKYVGYMPDNWRAMFSTEELPDITKKVKKIFSSFATDAYTIKEYGKDELKFQMAMLSDKLSEVFKEVPKISFINSGEYGKVFRIQCAKEDLALKIFHSDSYAYNSFDHGNLKEIGNAIALNHTLKPNQRSRFYCAKLSDDSEEGAFMLTHFVEENSKTPKQKLKLKRFILGDDKKSGNIKGHKIVDYGAIYKASKETV